MKIVPALSVVVAALAVSACTPAQPATTETVTVAPDSSSAGDSSAQPAGDSPSQTDAGAASANPTTSPDVQVPDGLGDVVAKREIVADNDTFLLEVFSLKREGQTAMLNARLTYVEVDGDTNMFLLSPRQLGREAIGTPTVFTLTDAAEGKLYLPARDAEDLQLCGPPLDQNATTGGQVYISCIFGAPPASTSAVDVTAGPFGAFNGVPIQ